MATNGIHRGAWGLRECQALGVSKRVERTYSAHYFFHSGTLSNPKLPKAPTEPTRTTQDRFISLMDTIAIMDTMDGCRAF